MLHDDPLEVDLVAFFPKPFTTEAIPPFAAAAPFVSALRQSVLTRRWKEMRAVILTRFLAPHVERLVRKLSTTDPELVAFLDANLDALRNASRVIPGFKNRVFPAADLNDTRSYLYWKYSRDVLGKPAGLTKTALERQLGPEYFNVPVQFSFPCPNCCADAECTADAVGELAPNELRMQCRVCGHVGYHRSYGDDSLASHVLCGCAYCVAEVGRAGAELQRLQWDLIPGLVSYVRTEIANVGVRLRASRKSSADAHTTVRDFAGHWAAGGKGDFADALDAWIRRRHPRLFYPRAYLEQAWALVDALAGAGVVSVEVTCDADDDQHILEDIVLDRAARFTRDDEEQRRAEQKHAEALTAVLKGFTLDQPGSLPDWLRAVHKIGLFDCWFTLPCDIECRLNPQRLASAAGAASTPHASRARTPTLELEAAIALLRAHGYRVTAPSQRRTAD